MLKNHANLFDNVGPQRMAYLLVSQNKDVRDAPLTIGCKPSTFSQSYFSDVIIKYCERHPLGEDMLEEVFKAHDMKRTKQLLFADLVMKADKDGDAVKQTQLSKFINRILGDVTLTATWAPFLGATNEEASKLKRAMQQVNLWFTRRIIETFFEVCVQDGERKNFWLEYVQYVRGFKIVGSKTTKGVLQSDQRVSTMFQRHFIETNSTYSQTAALVLCIKNYVLVEFSDTGSVYAYKQTHNKVQFLKRNTRFLTSTNDLKDTSLDNLVESDYWYGLSYSDEGRLTHRGYWQDRLKKWLQNKVMSSANTGTSYFDTKDDNIFIAQPLPKQKKIEKPIEPVIIPKVEPVTKPVTPIQRPVSKPTIQPSVQVLTNAVYRQNVNYLISSKWIFNDSCRVVCNSHGFFVNIARTGMFVKITGLNGASPTGNIWIKRPNLQGWSKIIHAVSSDINITVGYIKQGGVGLIYKYDLTQCSFMAIKTR